MVTIPADQYNPNLTYRFTDKDGNTFESRGDNGYVWQSITEGVPITRTSSGEWYNIPFIESDGTQVTAHIPEWFRNTSEYSQWQSTYVSQMINDTLSKDRLSQYNDILRALGDQGATKVSLVRDIASYGVTDPNLQNKYQEWMFALGGESKGTPAQITGLKKDGSTQTIADIAREFKDVSKEDLSSSMTTFYDIANQARNGQYKGSQEDVLKAVSLIKILNYVDDNSSKFGNDNEFQGLLAASPTQNYNAMNTSFMQTMMENFPIANLGARVVYGIGQLTKGQPFSMTIEEGREELLNRAAQGGELEGREASMQVGNVIGTVGNIAATMELSVAMGNFISGKAALASPGSFLERVGDFAKTIPGAMVTDFVVNDIPIDLTFFASDLARTGSAGKAWYNPDEEQPLFGIPLIGNFGPKVPSGLAMNLLGDAIIDVSIPVISTVGGTSYKKLDQLTSGGLTRAREKAAITNLKVQEKLANLPVLGTGWQKFINHMMGAENASYIREARKAAIIEGSMEPYVRAQNSLTLYNHAGMTDVEPLLKSLNDSLGISKSTKTFLKNANRYGGVGEVSTKWKVAEAGTSKQFSKHVPDILPRQVKQGLLDVERLSELKGEVADEGGLLSNPQRKREIADIEARLEKTPQEIKDFAYKFSDYNKGLENIAVKLGVKNEDWLAALNADPRWKEYMTRQALTPGSGIASPGGSVDPSSPAILNKSRKGYYADNYLDPLLSFGMKVEALGRAHAWNERSKALVSFELSQGKIIAGKGGIEAAKRLEEIKAEIKGRDILRQKIGYDSEVSRFNKDMASVNNAFNKVNDLLHLPEKINIKSIYDAKQDPRIKTLVDDFETGKIQFDEGVKEAAGLSDSDAAAIVRNTYAHGGDNIIADSVSVPTKKLDYTAGMTDAGVPYKYTIEDGKITGFEKVEGSEEMAEAMSNISGVYGISPETIDNIGISNAEAINRTILFYRSEIPTFGDAKSVFRIGNEKGVWGWIPGIESAEYGWRVENGHLVADEYPVYMGQAYRKGNEANLLEDKRQEVASGFKPANTATAESTPTHESGHSLMIRLTQAEINRKVDDGLLTIPENSFELRMFLRDQWDLMHESVISKAMEKIGIEATERNITEQANTISKYAASTNYGRSKRGKWRHDEVISEALRAYQGNGANSSKFCLAVVEELKRVGERHSIAVEPGRVFAKNNLDAPAGLFKNDNYNFPAKVKTDAQRAKWLDEWRQKNPYAKGKGLMTEEQYQKANLWDTYFQKEVRSFDPNSSSSMPSTLVKKNGEFLEELSKSSAKRMVDEIRKASVKGFSQELATMALSRNSRDINKAMEEFIIKRVNQSADDIAAKMPGGATAENLNKVRATLWAEDNIRNDTINMVSNLVPDGDLKDIQSMVDNLFNEQSKGFASIDALPIETKSLIEQKEKLMEELNKDNNYAKKVGKKLEKDNTEYLGAATQIVSYKQGGEDVFVVVDDPVVASMLRRPTDYKETGLITESLAEMANFISRTYRIGTTGIAPLAFVRNVLRDPMQATIQGGFNPLNMNLSPEVFYHTLRNYGLDDDTIETVTQRLRVWAGSSTLTNEMRNMGVTTPSKIGYRNKVEKISKKVQRFGDTKVMEVLEAPLEAWESMFRNQIAQQSFVKNFDKTRDVNRAMGAAMLDASNSTTNFSHSVGMFKRATSTVPYLSSAINGVRSFWTQFNVDPIGMVTRITAGFMVPAMAITAWNLADEERRKKYLNMPEWYRDGHIVLLDLDGNAFAFPIPEELQQFYGTARRLMEYSQEANPYSIPSILAQGAFGFLPASVDGYFSPDGTIDWQKGTAQMVSGILPQAATAIYEFVAEKDLFTGADLSDYDGLNKLINTLSNLFGTGFKNVVNDIGMMAGATKKRLVGESTADTLARDLFGMGFNDATNQFMNMIGSPSEVTPEGKETKATGLFAESETLQKQIEGLNKKIATSTGSQKEDYEKEKQELIDNFTQRVSNLTHNYMSMYSITGGLEDWQKAKIISILTLGGASSSSASDSWQYSEGQDAYLAERGLAQQRYVDAGLPAGSSVEGVLQGDDSIALQAAVNRFYGVPKQAATDFTNALKDSGLKKIRNEFYDAVSKIYDLAEQNGVSPDYDLIEKIQARYLQAVDNVLVPIINQYGVNILNNNDFIDEVRRYVNGMVPSNDWRRSGKNAKKYLSTKEYPLATVDVKKWLIQRYSSGMKSRGIASDSEVTSQLRSIKADIDSGKSGSAKGKINSLMNGVKKANYYISSEDMQTLTQYNNMLK